MTSRFALLTISFLLAGCAEVPGSADPDALAADEVGQLELPIINGDLDTTHPAVVRHESQGFCTATIVKVEGSTGYALTAAHCISPNVLGRLKQGQDASQPEREYSITKHAVHPDYSKASAFDFAMVTFEGADASTPVLPMLDPAKDSYKPGFPLTFVGYGVVKQGPGGDNSERRVIENKIASASPLRFVFDQMEKGFCSGDSGGPGLTVQQPERVAAVIQAVSGTPNGCSDQGFAGRLSAVYNEFVEPYIEGKPFKLQSCDICRTAVANSESACFKLLIDCSNNAKCLGYLNCVGQCNTRACLDDCAAQHPDGQAMYAQVQLCSCQQCASECDGDAQCDDAGMSSASSSAMSSTGAGVGGAPATGVTSGAGASDAAGVGGGGGESATPNATADSGCSVKPQHSANPRNSGTLWLGVFAALAWLRRRQKGLDTSPGRV